MKFIVHNRIKRPYHLMIKLYFKPVADDWFSTLWPSEAVWISSDRFFLAATKQLYKWYFPSARLSVGLFVTPVWLCSHHRIIMKFSGVITNDQSKVHAKGQGQRSRSQRSKTNLTVSGLSLQFEFTHDDEMMHTAWCCLEKVLYCLWRSSVKFQGHTALKIVEFDLDWAFPDCTSSFITPMVTKWCTKLEVNRRGALLFFKVIRQIARVTRL